LTYRPLTFFTFVLDFALWQDNPLGYHLTNVLLAAIAAIAAFFLAKNLLPERYALLSAVIFAILPGQSEAVISVFNRSQVLTGLGILVAVVCFCQTVRREIPWAGWKWLGALALFLGCLAKESALVTPLLCVLVIFLFRPCLCPRGELRRTFALHAATIGLYLILRYHAFGTFGIPGMEGFLDGEGWWGRYNNICRILTEYFRLAFFPYPLSCDYPWQPVSFHWSSLVYPLIFPYAAYLLCRGNERTRLWSFSLLWFVVCLLPVLHLAPLQIPFAERLLYPASLGVSIILAWLVAQAGRSKALYIVLLLLPMTGLTFLRCYDWRSNSVLWRRTLEVFPESYRAWIYLGAEYGRTGMALASRHSPKADTCHRQAVVCYEKALQLNPNRHNRILIYYNLGITCFWLGEKDKSRECFQSLLQLAPDYTPAWLFLGDLAWRAGQRERARLCYSHVKGPRNRWDRSYREAQEKIRKCTAR
jgi:tetratricopeptide (TPR) repeat protein